MRIFLALLLSVTSGFAATLTPGGLANGVKVQDSTYRETNRTTLVTITGGNGTNINAGSLVLSNGTSGAIIQFDSGLKLQPVAAAGLTSSQLAGFISDESGNAGVFPRFNLTSPAQGDIAYYSGSTWVNLGPGTAGQFLETRGAAQIPRWGTPSGAGDVTGPGSSTDNALPRFDSTTGKILQGSGVTVDDSNNLTVPGAINGGTSGTAGAFVLYDTDGDQFVRITPTGVTTADVNLILPAAPSAGLWLSTVSATTNDTVSKITTYAGLVGAVSDLSTATRTLTGATIDAANNVLKFTDYKDFVYPSRVDGAGATIVTNDYTSGLWGLVSYSGTADTNGNYAIFRLGVVPLDLDTGVALVLKNLAIRVSATDTDAAEFTIALWSPASSSAYSPTDFTALSTFINFDSGTLTSPAANDIFYCADVTLTGWAAALTAGRPLIIGIARRNGSNDDSVTIVSGTLSYGRTM